MHSRTQILTISKSGFLEGLDDGKLKNDFFPKWKWSDLLTDLNYHGMAERIRWVPPPKSLLCVEIGPRFEVFGFLENLTTFRGGANFQKNKILKIEMGSSGWRGSIRLAESSSKKALS